MEHDHLLSTQLLSTHLKSASFTISLTCYPFIFYQFTCYLFLLALGLTFTQASLALATLPASLAIRPIKTSP